jgi:hypothetical protein
MPLLTRIEKITLPANISQTDFNRLLPRLPANVTTLDISGCCFIENLDILQNQTILPNLQNVVVGAYTKDRAVEQLAELCQTRTNLNINNIVCDGIPKHLIIPKFVNEALTQARHDAALLQRHLQALGVQHRVDLDALDIEIKNRKKRYFDDTIERAPDNITHLSIECPDTDDLSCLSKFSLSDLEIDTPEDPSLINTIPMALRPGLKRLTISNTTLPNADFLMNMTGLEVLMIDSCSFEDENLHLLKEMKNLKIFGVPDLKDNRNLSNLSNAPKICRLVFPNESAENIADIINELPQKVVNNINYLDFSNDTALRSLPIEVSKFVNAKSVCISSCNNLSDIESLKALPNLSFVDANGCCVAEDGRGYQERGDGFHNICNSIVDISTSTNPDGTKKFNGIIIWYADNEEGLIPNTLCLGFANNRTPPPTTIIGAAAAPAAAPNQDHQPG